MLGVAFLAWVIWLIATGRLSKWAKASLQNQKWNAQDNKFNNELKSLARAINEQHAQLGKETWEARISNPGYEDAYNKLVNVNQQVLSMEMHASSLKEELEKFNQDRAKIESKYKEQLNTLDKERETAQAAGVPVPATGLTGNETGLWFGHCPLSLPARVPDRLFPEGFPLARAGVALFLPKFLWSLRLHTP